MAEATSSGFGFALARQRTELGAGDAWATCPLGGTWRTIRPAGKAAASAAEAHRIQHAKGWPLECQLPPAPPVTPIPQAVRLAARKARSRV